MFELFISLSGASHVEYYCGDAAGRSGDFSDSDRVFAENAQIMFKVPEEVFTYEVHMKHFPIDDIIAKIKLLIVPPCGRGSPRKVTIIMVGPQGSGKSTLSKQISTLIPAIIVNADTQGKSQHRIFQQSLDEPLIIVDNTNRDIPTRKQWMRDDRQTVIIYFDVPKSETFGNVLARETLTGIHIPRIAIHTYYKNLVTPSSDEGLLITLN
jgi:hypothetical protein